MIAELFEFLQLGLKTRPQYYFLSNIFRTTSAVNFLRFSAAYFEKIIIQLSVSALAIKVKS